MSNRALVFNNNQYIETTIDDINEPQDNCIIVPSDFCKYSTSGLTVISVSSNKGSQVVLPPSSLKCIITKDVINVLSGTPYINGKLVTPGEYVFSNGDRLYSDGVEMCFSDTYIGIRGNGYRTSLNEHIDRTENIDGFPEYKRSPRIIKREPIAGVELVPPPKASEKKKGELAKLILTPLATAAVTGIMSFILGRGIMVLMAFASTLVSIVVSVTNYIQNRKETNRKEKERRDAYEKYLLEQQQILAQSTNKFIDSKRYHNPSVREIENMVSNYSSRIYERRANDYDFLQFSIGLAECTPSFKISAKLDDVEYKNDPLYCAMKEIYSEFKTVNDIPVVVDLKNAHVGIVGEKEYIQQQLFSIITQLCFLQSYHDIEIITLVGAKSRENFEWIRWFPHCRIKSINVSGLISGENQRDQVLGNISQVFKMRKIQKDESKSEGIFMPHYIFIIEEPKMLINHNIMEYLQSETANLGYSMIYTTNQLSNLPENIKTILLLDSDRSGRLLMREGALENLKLKTNNTDGVDLPLIARQLAPLVHNKGVSSQIPESITFFDLYGVKTPDEIPVEALWEKNASFKSLAVPLGVRGKDDIVYLNLHEKAHGPHGLVAGTTGSGKSEILQSFILSLAINFHPHEVGFLLIDYKGGGMANLFKDLPHLLGTITNLDGSESMRALASIQAENRRRQRVFGEVGVNNISQYTKLFKSGDVAEPMPHLFIISDEFAELKKEQPDFMKELVSTARIGRSLGVHLILATQKPTGVVDDQIWSNSRFKLALKVQNEADSKEVIKTPDAARITQPGRAILQVGNNEIYETFQSAWSGASYSQEQVEKAYDGRVYMINELGQGVLLNQDLSDTSAADNTKITQLDAVVAKICNIYKKMKCQSVQKPWLPPLPQAIVSPHINIEDIVDSAEFDSIDAAVSLGIIDLPEMQSQMEYSHDFLQDGNLAIFGASGYGKSTLIVQIALALAIKNSPEMMKYYVLDLGNSALIPLKGLPQTADYLSFDDTEKLKKLMALLTDEISLRKKLFAREGAINFNMYNSVSKEKLPVIIFFIDNYDVVREMGVEIEDYITKITRDGAGLGIITVFTASRASAVRYAVLNNFKNKICNYLFDHAEINSLVGRSAYTLPEIKGRAMVKLKEPAIMQAYLPAEFEDEIGYASRIREIVQRIADTCSVSKARGIPMLPEVLTRQELMAAVPRDEKRIAIGLDTNDVLPQYLPDDSGKVLIVGGSQSGKTNILSLIISQLKGEMLFICDSKTGDLLEYAQNPGIVYMSDAVESDNFIIALENLVKERHEAYKKSGGKLRPREFFSSLPRATVIIDEGENFVELTKSYAKRAEAVLADALNVGVTVITATLPTKLKGYDSVSKILKETSNGIVTGNPSEQSVLQMSANRSYKPQIDMAFIVKNGRQTLVMVPRA